MANDANQDRIKKDEEELKALMAERDEQEKGEVKDPELVQAEAILADDNASKEDKSWAKRYSDTKSAWYKESNNQKELIKELQSKLEKTKDSATLPTTVEDLEAWQVENPQMAGAIRGLATKIAKEMTGGLESKVNELSEKSQKSTMELTRTKVLKKHPDLDAVNKTEAFHDWVKEQDAWVDSAVYAGTNAKTIIQALDLYKLENNLFKAPDEKQSTTVDTKQAEVDAASLVATSKAETPSATSNKLLESEVIKWTDKEWEEKKPLYDKARREGTLVLDVTHAA